MTPSPGPLAGVFNKRAFYTCVPSGQLVFLDLSSLAIAVPPPEQLFAVVSENEAEWPRVLNVVRDLNAYRMPTTQYAVRPVFIQDGPGTFPASVLATMPKWGQPWKELYRYKGETLAIAQARWIAEAADLERRWSYDLGAIIQTYTMNGLYTEAEVVAIASAAVAHLNARGPRWKLAPGFAYDRADAVQWLLRTICSQSPGWPTLEPVDHPIPPHPKRSTTLMAAADQIVDVIHSLGNVKSSAAGMTRLGFTCPDGTKNCVASVHVNPDGTVTIIAFGQDHDNPTEQFYIDPAYPDRATAKVNGVYYTFLVVDIAKFPS